MGQVLSIDDQPPSAPQSPISLPKVALSTTIVGVLGYLATRHFLSWQKRTVVVLGAAAAAGVIAAVHGALRHNEPQTFATPSVLQQDSSPESVDAPQVAHAGQVAGASPTVWRAYATATCDATNVAPIHNDRWFSFADRLADERGHPLLIGAHDFYVPFAMVSLNNQELPNDFSDLMWQFSDGEYMYLPSTLFSQEVRQAGSLRFHADGHLIELQFGTSARGPQNPLDRGKCPLGDWLDQAAQAMQQDEASPYLFKCDLPVGNRLLHGRILKEPKRLQFNDKGCVAAITAVNVDEVPAPPEGAVSGRIRFDVVESSGRPIIMAPLEGFKDLRRVQLHVDGRYLYVYADRQQRIKPVPEAVLEAFGMDPESVIEPGNICEIPDYLSGCVRLPDGVDIATMHCTIRKDNFLQLTFPMRRPEVPIASN